MKARRIELKTLSDGAFSYQGCLSLIVCSPTPGAAFNYAEVAKRGDIADEIEKAKDELLLTPAHWSLVSSLVKSFDWTRIANPQTLIFTKGTMDAIREFTMDIENASEVDLAPKEPEVK